jgi:hypothetical protein
MHRLAIVQERGGRAALDTFDAALYFAILRTCGGNPHVRADGIYCRVLTTVTIINEADRWAARHDPNGVARVAYARGLWLRRSEGTDVLELG